ncbi:MAG: hypothetical protein LUP97_03300 [Methanoregula sp.]|nr:hypothetical protein [Methanoregula sp.]
MTGYYGIRWLNTITIAGTIPLIDPDGAVVSPEGGVVGNQHRRPRATAQPSRLRPSITDIRTTTGPVPCSGVRSQNPM